MKKFCLLFWILFTISAVMAGCSKDTNDDKTMSVSEEIALSTSETSIPIEAYNFTGMEFDIPEGMIAASENTEDMKYYLASDAENLSFISSTRSKKEKAIDYSFTSESYAGSLESQLGSAVTMNDFSKEECDGYIKYRALVSYELDGNKYDLTAYIFDTESFLFSVSYCLGGNRASEESFKNSEATLRLVSLAQDVSINDTDSSQNSVNVE